MTAIEATNRGLADMPWAMLTTAPAVQEVDVEALQTRPPDAAVLDVREQEEYAHGHVPGAINLPQADLASQLDQVPRDRPVFVICQSGARSLRSAQFLKQMGFDAVMSVRGGTEAWRAASHPVAQGEAAREQPRIAESEWAHAGLGS
jgi:rhodanese-related sulfurtransferase